MQARPCSSPPKSGADRNTRERTGFSRLPRKTVDHGDGAERGIEIKDGGTPLAIHYLPRDPDALYRWEESSENRLHPRSSLNGRANRSHELYIVVKWRSTYIPCSKPVQVRFNGMDHVLPHEKLHFSYFRLAHGR